MSLLLGLALALIVGAPMAKGTGGRGDVDWLRARVNSCCTVTAVPVDGATYAADRPAIGHPDRQGVSYLSPEADRRRRRRRRRRSRATEIALACQLVY
nr:unnamed protein product [Digitaria exilis]